MSKNPQNLPKRTRVLVKDILFQEKYRLTHTQVDIMAYIINALVWSTKVGAFFPVTNKKFHEDLPQISEKTLEESLRVLKAMELIEVQMITVPKWNNAYVRGIAVLPKGLEYNARYYQAKEQTVIDNLNEQMLTKDQEIRELKEQLKELEATKTNTKIVEEAIEKDNDMNYNDLEFTSLVKTVTKEFGATSQPICNGVKGWKKEVQFYINSYNRLTILSPTGEVVQLKSPLEISDFWKYLSKNRHQIGKVIDFTKKLTVNELNNRYVKMNIVFKENKFKVHQIEKLKEGVQVLIQSSDTNNISVLSKHGKAIVFKLEECEKVLLGLRR
ncbi:MAG: Unknown protein [uncultured Sulfurovum sp.]|uniref:Uncharacterized protein n=1 Tax=uncultured Sulfurovum sp. TaxID=269237 RepID=A0A6S6U5H0_9BACT|nr:MAG: Unknown protein [uncultured Sulfurovum sp.]